MNDYRSIDAVNWSTLKEMRKSPRHYLHAVQRERTDTRAMLLGRAGHTAILEPDRFLLDYVMFGGDRRAGKVWDAFAEENAGKEILKLDEYQLALEMRNAVEKHPRAVDLLSSGTAEVALQWTDEKTGLACKGRVDWTDASRRIFVDVKTAADIESAKFASAAARLGYHGQLAMYRRGLEATHGRTFDGYLIAVENKAPHDVAVFRYDEDVMYAADCEVGELLARVAQCRASGEWPGQYPGETSLYLPAWAQQDEGINGLDLMVSGQEV